MARRGNLKSSAPTSQGQRGTLAHSDHTQPIPPPPGFVWAYPPAGRDVGEEIELFQTDAAKRVFATWLTRAVAIAGVANNDTTKQPTSKLATFPKSA